MVYIRIVPASCSTDLRYSGNYCGNGIIDPGQDIKDLEH